MLLDTAVVHSLFTGVQQTLNSDYHIMGCDSSCSRGRVWGAVPQGDLSEPWGSSHPLTFGQGSVC